MTTLTRPDTVPADRLRQVAVTVAELFCVVGTLVGVGVIGTRVAESAGGALAADATLIAPAGPAFAIWTPIYLGLAGFTVYQWLPTQTAEPRHRAIGWLAAASMVLNAAWLLVTQQDWIWVSVVVMAALVVTLGAARAAPAGAPVVRPRRDGARRRHLRPLPRLGRRRRLRERHRRARRERRRPRRVSSPSSPPWS